MKKYIIENNNTMPLCCVQDNIYFDYLTGEVITDKSVLKFISDGLKCRAMEAKEIDLKIIEIYDGSEVISYNYIINGYSNYLNINRQPLNDFERTNLTNLLMKGKFKQEVIWE